MDNNVSAPIADSPLTGAPAASEIGCADYRGLDDVASSAEAYARICAGASLIQLYTAMTYQRPGIVRRLCAELDALLAREGKT